MPRRRNADIEGLLHALVAGGVRFVVVGGVGAALQGVPAITYDLDVVLDPAEDNLSATMAVLGALDACYREHIPGKRIEPIRSDLATRGAKLLMTRLGPLDILGELAPGWRYGDLEGRTRELPSGKAGSVRVLDLAALITVKEAVGREKDRAVLPLYRKTLLEREEPSGDGSESP